MHCGVPPPPPVSTRPTYQVTWGRHSRKSSHLLPPPPHISNYYSFQRLWRIFRTASIRMSSYTVIVKVSIFCFYHFLIGRLEAEILTAKVGENQWNFGGREYFCWRQYFVTFWHGGLEQPGRDKSAHISWPAGYSQLISDYTRRRQHLQRRTPARSERSQLLWTLLG
jgi:hypothetical protein